jgi:carboxyl-terminal processing protease
LKLQYKYAFIATLIFALGMIVGSKINKNMQPAAKDPNAKLNEIAALLKEHYVDEVNVDSVKQIILKNKQLTVDSIENVSIKQILELLDPHTVYLPPAQLKQSNEEMKGSFAGVGIEYINYKDTIYVAQVIKDGPAFAAKIQVGEQLLKVDDSIVSGVNISNAKLRGFLRGNINSAVKVTMRKTDGNTYNTTIKRGNIALPSIDAAYMLENKIGYIKLAKFSMNSHKEVVDAIQFLQKQGMQSLIFDLRENSGGSLSDAVNIVDEFVAGKELVTFTKGKKAPKEMYYTKLNGAFETGKLTVLINENSASASEVVAGALQDLDRATIIGRRSFGKGLVQQQFGLQDKSAIRITVAKYYTPSGRSIQKDYTKGKSAYAKELEDRYNGQELQIADSNKLNTDKVFVTKKGKKVFGGGGIMPDVFVGIDSITHSTGILNQLFEKSIPYQFATLYFFKNKTLLNSYKNATDFGLNYKLSASDWKTFTNQIDAAQIASNQITASQKTMLTEYIIQNIARLQWGTKGYHEVINLKDKTIIKAKSLLNE